MTKCIIHRDYKLYITKFAVSNLNYNQLSHSAKRHVDTRNLKYLWVKTDEFGTPLLRGKKREYRIFDHTRNTIKPI